MTETTSYYKKVASVTVTNGGSDYTSAPTVTIAGNATATATVSGGVVTAITVTSVGHNYLSPPEITFSGGDGSGATATANMVYIDDDYNGFKESLSHLISNQLPDFVRTEYPVFITFLEKYYEFLDQENQVNNFLLNYEKNFDINRTLDTFIPKFKNQYAQNFPLTAQIDDRRLIKFIKQFYEAKGSEKAIELLFRILYNEKTEIFYPSEQVLRASDGIWIEDITLKLAVDQSIIANPFDLNSKTVKITYYENISSVTYERTVETNISNVTKFAYVFPAVYELVTSLPKTARILVPGAGAAATVTLSSNQVDEITIDDGGNGYFAAPAVQFTSSSGSGATGRAVLSGTGQISHVIITNGGSGYLTPPAVTFSTEAIRTKVEIVSGDTITQYGYVVRQLSTVEVIDCSGTPPCGFSVGDIFSIDETGSVGSYTIDNENDTLEYFLNKYNETDAGLNPYTLVGRDNKASIRIDAIDTDGCPTAVSIFDTGFDFERETFTAEIVSPLGCTATLSFTTGAVNVKVGRFKDSRGMLSNVNKLQDNFYYQNYSYVVRSNVPSNKWLDIVKNTAHPAGTAIFGELTIEQVVDFSQYITTPIQPLQIYEFVLEELTADTFYYAVDFIKVLSDSASVSEAHGSHLFKVLADSAVTSETTNFEFDIGIYENEDDTTTSTDLFDRVVQYVREVNETTITAENAITNFSKVLEEQLHLISPYAPGFFDENYVAADTTNYSFNKILSDIISPSEINTVEFNKNGITDTAIVSESLGRSVEYYRTFVDSVIIQEYTSASIVRPSGIDAEQDVDSANANETSTSHLYKYLTDSVTSTDTVGIIPYLVKTDNAGATELLIVANDSVTIDSIAATEQSLINILKGLFETVTVTEDGIVNTQNYVDGDFGSDYVGQATYFN